MSIKKANVGISLSGGGMRGFAHIGALQALWENDVKPEVVSGTSAGAIIGAFYASGMKPERIFELLKRRNVFNTTKIHVPNRGLLGLDGLGDILSEEIPYESIEELPVPLIVTCTNLNTGKVTYFDRGELVPRIIASASIPVIFSPVEIDGEHYCDGGVLDNLPIQPIRSRCERLIGVNISPINPIDSKPNLLDVAIRSFQLIISSKVEDHAGDCDLFIAPSKLRNYSLLESDQADAIYQIGYETMHEALSDTGMDKVKPSSWFQRILDQFQ